MSYLELWNNLIEAENQYSWKEAFPLGVVTDLESEPISK